MEMSGFEPESERFLPRISTSVVDYLVSPVESQATGAATWLTAETRKPLFRIVSGVANAALHLFDAQSYLREEHGVGGRDPGLEGQELCQSLMQRVA